MHKLIKESLEESFQTLNTNLIDHSDRSKLDVVIDTIKQATTGEMYINEIGSIFEKHPNIYSPIIQKSLLNILDILDGTHPLIDECFKEDTTKSALGYRCDLTQEIITNVNFLRVCDNGDVKTNDVPNISFISEVEALGKLSIIDQYDT